MFRSRGTEKSSMSSVVGTSVVKMMITSEGDFNNTTVLCF